MSDLLFLQSYALRIALGGVGVCIGALLLGRVLRRRSAPTRYGVLFAGVVGLLALPVLIGLGQVLSAAFMPETPVQEEVAFVPAELFLELMQADAQPEANPPSVETPWLPIIGATLLGLWSLGIVIGLANLTRALWKQRRILVGAAWQTDFWNDDLRARLAHTLGLRTFPEVRVSPVAPMPMVLGYWRPCIVLPESAPAWTQAQWEAVLLHEGAHIARRDPWAILVQQVAVILFWWCPFVHRLARNLGELREEICDDYALQGPCDQVRYAELLVESAERVVNWKSVPVAALLDSAHGGLEARVMRLLDKERQPMTRLSLPAKLFGAGVLVFGSLLLTGAAAFSQPQPEPGKKVQIKILVDGVPFPIELDNIKIVGQADAAPKPAQNAPIFTPAQGGGGAVFGDVLVTSDGKLMTIWDPKTGKVIAKFDAPPTAAFVPAKPGQGGGFGWGFVPGQGPQPKPDPRIEELVKQAEAIKPGSGAEIRRALQGGAAQNFMPAAKAWPMVPGVPAQPGQPGQPMTFKWHADLKDKKIIILQIEDGKVKQLSGDEAKKLLGGPRFHIELDPTKPMAVPMAVPMVPKTSVVKPALPPTPVTPPAPGAGGDTQALRRQLDEIRAQLDELRKRLDAKK